MGHRADLYSHSGGKAVYYAAIHLLVDGEAP
jgi:hypothetical protein